MKIPLSQDELANLASSNSDIEALQHAIAGCRLGDWEAKHNLERLFQPLLVMLATRRAGDDAKLRNALVERGREGLYRAAKRFPRNDQVRHFRLFALTFVEAAMDNPPGFWRKLWAAWCSRA